MKNISICEGVVTININPDIYPLDVIYSASYVFLERTHIFLDGCPTEEVFVEMKSKKNEDLEKLAMDFIDELITYADYKKRAEKSKKIREAIIQRALLSNDPSLYGEIGTPDGANHENESLKEIAIPWEERQEGDKGKISNQDD